MLVGRVGRHVADVAASRADFHSLTAREFIAKTVGKQLLKAGYYSWS